MKFVLKPAPAGYFLVPVGQTEESAHTMAESDAQAIGGGGGRDRARRSLAVAVGCRDRCG